MASAVETKENSSLYAGVLMASNHYVAFKTKENGVIEFISDPETDLKVAQAVAQVFAKDNQISYKEEVQKLNKPIMTIIQNNVQWYPAEIYSDRISGIDLQSVFPLGPTIYTKKRAMWFAERLSNANALDFLPNIGISMAQFPSVNEE